MSLEDWRTRLGGSNLPVFARTVRDVGQVATSSRSSANDLSEVIGRDAAMVTRLLRIANSSLFNLQNKPVETISAAVVMIGFDAVRDLAVSVSLIEKMLKGEHHARVVAHLAQAFHAAAQAKSFAEMAGEVSSEEVFVAALLRDVGELAFWAQAAEEGAEIEARCARGESFADAQRAVLGFDIRGLSKMLAKDWQLGELVYHAADNSREQPRVQEIQLAHELAQLVGEHGWSHHQVDTSMTEIAQHLDVDVADLRDVAADNFECAKNIAAGFGIERLSAAFPPAPRGEALLDSPVSSAASPVAESSSEVNPDPATDAKDNSGARQSRSDIQVTYIARIAEGIAAQRSRDELMQCVVDGLQRSLGLRSVEFALLVPDQARVAIKYRAPSTTDAQDQPAQVVPLTDALADVLADGYPKRLDAQAAALWPGRAQLVGRVALAGKPVGLIACGLVDAEVPSDQHETSLALFVQQAVLVLLQTKA